ncbi:MAG TPA: hypothetical protein ENJ35_05415, partial [Gammaproteobacteria bacterium]|nr:hypothetical protein [Gammaproteobacteria bacterium]
VNFMASTINRQSYLDLSDHYHYTRLPDLAKFVNLGFPYSKYADLGKAAVVLPQAPSHGEIQFMLNTMGLTAAATGYPAFNVTLLFPNMIDLASNKNILLIGGNDRQPLAEKWKGYMAVNRNDAQEWQLRRLSLGERLALWWKGEKLQDLKSARRTVERNSKEFTGLTGFRSPLDNHHAVIMLISSSPEKLAELNDALSDPSRFSLIQGDLSILDDSGIQSFRTLPSYYVGTLPWYHQIRWYLSTHILALIILTIIVMVIAAWILVRLLSRHAAERFTTGQ